MSSRSARLLAALIGVLAATTACETVRVDSQDETPPTLTLALVAPTGTYEDGTRVSAPVDTSRTFSLRPTRDSRAIQLVFLAVDEESGIESVDGSISIGYTCDAGVHGTAEKSRIIVGAPGQVRDWLADDAGVADKSAVAVASFTPRELWRGDCETWGAADGVTSATIRDIRASYSSRASNNSAACRVSETPTDGFSPCVEDLSETSISGTLTITDTTVSY